MMFLIDGSVLHKSFMVGCFARALYNFRRCVFFLRRGLTRNGPLAWLDTSPIRVTRILTLMQSRRTCKGLEATSGMDRKGNQELPMPFQYYHIMGETALKGARTWIPRKSPIGQLPNKSNPHHPWVGTCGPKVRRPPAREYIPWIYSCVSPCWLDGVGSSHCLFPAVGSVFQTQKNLQRL